MFSFFEDITSVIGRFGVFRICYLLIHEEIGCKALVGGYMEGGRVVLDYNMISRQDSF